MANDSGHGGKRPGARRPKGARGRRSEELADRLIAAGNAPWMPLCAWQRRQRRRETSARRSVPGRACCPYVYPKPKPVESDPEGVIALARGLAEARRTLIDEGDEEPWFAAFARELERAEMNFTVAQIARALLQATESGG